MTTLSRTFDSVEARERELRWAEWEAKATAADANLRRRVRIVWTTLTAAIILTAVLLL